MKTGARRRIWLWAGLAAAVMVIGVLAVIMLQPKSPPPSAAPDSRTGEAAEVARALEKLETDPGALLPPELESEFADAVSEAVPEGTEVVVDESTWVPSEARGGTIEIELAVPGERPRRVVAVMAEYEDGWKVLQTIEVERE